MSLEIRRETTIRKRPAYGYKMKLQYAHVVEKENAAPWSNVEVLANLHIDFAVLFRRVYLHMRQQV